MSVLVLLFLFGIGLCVGSFVNVAVFRFGFDERASKRSHCMACRAQLAWHDLLPVVSFLALRARCRACGSGLSIQYPIVELAVGTLFLLSGIFLSPAFSLWALASFVSLLVFLAVLVALVAYDIRHTLVPMPFVWALAGSATLASLFQSLSAHSLTPLYESALGAVALFGFFILIVLATRGKGMGAGDAYVAGALGILLGLTRGMEAVLIGVWIGTIVGLCMLFFKKHVTLKTELPLVPFLAFGTLLALYTDFSPLEWVARLSNLLFFGNVSL